MSSPPQSAPGPNAITPLGVTLRSVGRTFDDGTIALEDVSLDIAQGSFVALLGPSGCGKTTLLRMLGGLDQASTGTLEFSSSSAARVRPAPGERAFCFQEPRLLPWRGVLDNVALPLELGGTARPERLEAAHQMLERVGLQDAANKYPHELSGGMRMRAAIARALLTRPRILLLDEPFGALDEITRARLDDQLLELWEAQRTTVVLVTHSISESIYLAQQVHVMRPAPGRVIETLTPDFGQRGPALRTSQAFGTQVAMAHGALERGVLEASR